MPSIRIQIASHLSFIHHYPSVCAHHLQLNVQRKTRSQSNYISIYMYINIVKSLNDENDGDKNKQMVVSIKVDLSCVCVSLCAKTPKIIICLFISKCTSMIEQNEQMKRNKIVTLKRRSSICLLVVCIYDSNGREMVYVSAFN